MHDILERITLRSAELGTNDTALSRTAGSKDLIRNWRRSLAKDQPINAKMVSLEALASALEVPLQWLIDGTGYANKPHPSPRLSGFSESVANLWIPHQNVETISLAKQLAPNVKHPQFFKMTQPEIFLGLLIGDVLVVEANHQAKYGDLVIVNTYDEAGEAEATLVRRWFPPYLFSCNPNEKSATIILDDTGRAAIFGTVEASFRSSPSSK